LAFAPALPRHASPRPSLCGSTESGGNSGY
jgi:hypothetical protein